MSDTSRAVQHSSPKVFIDESVVARARSKSAHVFQLATCLGNSIAHRGGGIRHAAADRLPGLLEVRILEEQVRLVQHQVPQGAEGEGRRLRLPAGLGCAGSENTPNAIRTSRRLPEIILKRPYRERRPPGPSTIRTSCKTHANTSRTVLEHPVYGQEDQCRFGVQVTNG